MTIQIETAEITFRNAFRLRGMERDWPAGVYQVDTDRETIDGISFNATRRIATRIHLRERGTTELMTIDAGDLERALVRDGSAEILPQAAR